MPAFKNERICRRRDRKPAIVLVQLGELDTRTVQHRGDTLQLALERLDIVLLALDLGQLVEINLVALQVLLKLLQAQLFEMQVSACFGQAALSNVAHQLGGVAQKALLGSNIVAQATKLLLQIADLAS